MYSIVPRVHRAYVQGPCLPAGRTRPSFTRSYGRGELASVPCFILYTFSFILHLMNRIENKKARAEYELLDTYQAGLVLNGGEVKAIRAGKASLTGSYIKIYGNEAWLVNAHIAPYQEKNTSADYDPLRARKLLLQKRETNELIGKTKEKGFSVIPLQIFDKRGIVKIDIAFARGKKQRDKRESIKARETKRELDRSIKRT